MPSVTTPSRTERPGPLPAPHLLGLPEDAGDEQIRTAREQVLTFLEQAPEEIHGWAGQQTQELTAPAARTPRTGAATPAPAARRRRPVLVLATLILVPLLIWGVYKIGEVPAEQAGGAADPAMPLSQDAAPQGPDQEQVAALEARVEEDPTDTSAMSELGTLYLTAGDLDRAAHWQQRILAEHPDDVDARLALGVVLFNQGDLEAAERQWVQAAELGPDQAEPHYNLGFLHLSADPPDLDKVEEHWGKVLELDPDSDMAGTIANHLDSFGGEVPEGSDR